jgi:S-methylmethionine-dependent homocysteine/selenocysteine methylase
VHAGADVITTNAYALVPFHLGESRFKSEGRRLAALAGATARKVADRSPELRVAGCLPPVLGSYVVDGYDAARARPILKVLMSEQMPFVDLWLAETLSSIVEAELVGDVLDELDLTGRPRWISFTLADQLVEGAAVLRSGESITDAVHAAEAIGAELVSFNCSQPEVMETAVSEASAATTLRVGVYANAFVAEEDETANEVVHDLRDDVTPEAYVAWAQRWVAAGASMIGGCCGIGPEHIRALSAHLSPG